MKIIGLIRIRNESVIIQDTLDHMASFCTGGIYVYDDCSTDNTVAICKKHPAVQGIIEGEYHDNNREKAEYENRQAVLSLAQKNAGKDDWFIYMDADERIEFDRSTLEVASKNTLGIKMRLFDFYITEADKDLPYHKRKRIGPEYRDILFLFRNTPTLKYWKNDQREVDLGKKGKIIMQGFVKHYGKSISIQQREDTCEYYSKTFPKYAKKREARKGKAVHTHSDFGSTLIKWDQKIKKGFPLFLKEKRWHSIGWRISIIVYYLKIHK